VGANIIAWLTALLISAAAAQVPSQPHRAQFETMMQATAAQPVTHEELAASLTSPYGAARIRELFDDMIARAIKTPERIIFLETGGGASLNRGQIRFHSVEDMTRRVLPRLASFLGEPAGVLGKVNQMSELYEAFPREMADVDSSGQLKDFLLRLPGRRASGVSDERLTRLLLVTLRTVVENCAESWILDPEEVDAAIERDDWSGRFVGMWHTHPPVFSSAGWGKSNGPSGPDMENARHIGQYLTVAFHPAGFDVYDLAEFASAPSADPGASRRFPSARRIGSGISPPSMLRSSPDAKTKLRISAQYFSGLLRDNEQHEPAESDQEDPEQPFMLVRPWPFIHFPVIRVGLHASVYESALRGSRKIQISGESGHVVYWRDRILVPGIKSVWPAPVSREIGCVLGTAHLDP
jgi:hypothetical protein